MKRSKSPPMRSLCRASSFLGGAVLIGAVVAPETVASGESASECAECCVSKPL